MDALWVRQAQRGDPTALERLFRCHHGRIFRLCRAYTHNDSDADDLVQEAFVKAFRDLPRLQSPRAFRPWLAAIARNHARDAMAYARRRPTQPDPPGDATSDPSPSLETHALRAEARKLAVEIISSMPHGTPRRAAELFYLEDQEVKDVAHRLEMTVSNITTALSRARGWMRKHLIDQLSELRGYDLDPNRDQ